MPRIYRILINAAILLIAAVAPAEISAQNETQLTQYWAMPAYYNPAAAGSTDFMRIRGGAKLQWLGIENAPKSFIGVADSPFRIMGKRIGAGVNVSSESLGLFNNLLLSAQVAYQFKLGKGFLSVGVQPAYYSSKFKGSEVYIPDGDDYHQSGDDAIPTQDLEGHVFDLSAGLRYEHKYFSVGASVQHILDPKVPLSLEGNESGDQQDYETSLPRMAYFIVDSNIPVKNTLFVLQPSCLIKTDFSRVSAELTMRSTFNRFITFGVGYRWKEALSAMIGAEFKNFFIGYAFDYPLSAINRASSGSHEIVAGYSLKFDFSGKNKHKHRSIRIM